MVEEGDNHQQVPQKRMKFEEVVEEGGEDRISALPDYLIQEILCRLPLTKYAIRTGTLSKRWEHLWTSVHTLIFASIDSSYLILLNPESIDSDYLLEAIENPNPSPDFFSSVDKTLTQCRQLNLKKFEVHSSYDTRFESLVNKWIRYAIIRNVEELILRFSSVDTVDWILSDQLIFTSSCIRDMTLKSCKLNPTGAISWKNLRSLCIDGLLDEDLIANIINGSPVLESLELGDCYCNRRLDITSKSVKKLVLSGYFAHNFLFDRDIIEINAPNILSLTIKGYIWLKKLLLVNVSSLIEATLDYEKYYRKHKEEEEMLKRLIQNLVHVKELKIGSSCSKVVYSLEAQGFEFPSNVKFVKRSKWPDSDLDDLEDSD